MIILNILYLIMTNALQQRKELAIFYSRITILILLLASLLAYDNVYYTSLDKGIALYGGLFNISSLTLQFNIFIYLLSSIILIYNSYHHTQMINNESSKLKTILFKFASYNPIKLSNTIKQQHNIVEYALIILFILSGAVFLMSSGDLISLFIAIELQSYGLYILSTVYRDSERASWGGLTYFLLGGLSSCFILLGSALLYINGGTTTLDGIYIITTITDEVYNLLNVNGQHSNINYSDVKSLSDISYVLPINITESYYINLSLIFICVGFLFKISAAPFHFWSPDVYDAIPTTVTTYVAIIAKISIFIILLELVHHLNRDLSSYTWKNSLLISSMFSLIIGSVLGLTQARIKRVYAYSTINHVGFILLALSIDTIESIQAYIFYIISYSISNLNAFFILVTIGYTMYFYTYKQDKSKAIVNKENEIETSKQDLENNETSLNIQNKHDTKYKENVMQAWKHVITSEEKSGISVVNLHREDILNIIDSLSKDKNEYMSYHKTFNDLDLKDIEYSPIQLVNQLKGYFYINPYLSLSLAITLFSFMGIPPLIGFFAKQMVLSAALDNGYVFLTLLGILTSVIGAAYYLNIVKQIFFFNTDYILNPFLKHFNYFGYISSESIPFNSIWNANIKHNNQTLQTKANYISFKSSDIKIGSALSITISILTLILLLFIFIPNESFKLSKILSLLLFI